MSLFEQKRNYNHNTKSCIVQIRWFKFTILNTFRLSLFYTFTLSKSPQANTISHVTWRHHQTTVLLLRHISRLAMSNSNSGGVSESNSLVSHVVNSVVRSVKHVPEDPQGTSRSRDIHTHYTWGCSSFTRYTFYYVYILLCVHFTVIPGNVYILLWDVYILLWGVHILLWDVYILLDIQILNYQSFSD